jgi:hypothetical protein
MFSDTSGFTWQRPARGAGYSWQPPPEGSWEREQVGPTDLLLADPQGVDFVDYQPLAGSAALYRELAGVELTPEGTAKFANRFGRLGGGAERIGLRADVYSSWVITVAWLREAVRLWDLFREENVEALSEAFRWTGDRVDYVFSRQVLESLRALHPEKAAAAPSPRFDGEEANFAGYDVLGTGRAGLHPGFRIRQGDFLRPAIVFVITLINGHLPRHNGPSLCWDARRHSVVYVDAPFSLFGAVWLQFAQAVHLGKEARRCRECGLWFEVAPGSNRKDRVLCSDSCRSRSYQLRRARAVQLHTRGQSAREIANDVGSDVATVRKWINNTKGK